MKGASWLSVCRHDAAPSSCHCAFSSIHPRSVLLHPLSCPWALHFRRDADGFPLGSFEQEGEPTISLHLVPDLFKVPLGAHQLKQILCLWGRRKGNANAGNNLPACILAFLLVGGREKRKQHLATLTKDNTSINLRLVHCLWENDPFSREDSN